MRYTKPARKVSDLVALMKARGLAIEDEQSASEFLDRVSFFRLKGYLLHFEKKVPENEKQNTHKVPDGTKFSDVMTLYELDRMIRLLMFEAIEKIEICFRSLICNTYCVGANDPHWLLRSEHFTDAEFHARTLSKIKRDIGMEARPTGEVRDKEVFIAHYLGKYTEPEIPPCWALAECLSLGVWSQIYDKLSNRQGPQQISQIFQVPPLVLGSWMHTLTVMRNICAHHGRVWNRVFAIKPAVLPGYEHHFTYTERLYSQSFAAAFLVRRIYPESKWHLKMRDAMLSCPSTEKLSMGLFNNWEKEVVWSENPLPKYEIKTLAPKPKA